jgi:hypothetical protein
LTPAQGDYVTAFVAWMRGNDLERERIEPVLAELRRRL